MRLIKPCPICHKPLELTNSSKLIDQTIETFKCGHCFLRPLVTEHVRKDFKDLQLSTFDGSKTAYPYQVEGHEFITEALENQGGAILGDQMALGKTGQALLVLRNEFEKYTPCLIVVKSNTTWQWLREFKNWANPTPLGVYLIQGTKNWIPPGFHTYLISMDTFSRGATCKECGHLMNSHDYENDGCKALKNKKLCKCKSHVSNNDSMVEKLSEFPFKLVIVDEVHSFKNTDSNRSQALVKFIKGLNSSEEIKVIPFECVECGERWTKEITKNLNLYEEESSSKSSAISNCPKCGTFAAVLSQKAPVKLTERKCKVLMLSGTPIKNRASEFFVPLNLCAPKEFPSLANFTQRWLTNDGQRLNPYRIEAFHEAISPFYLRRERNKVLKDLPPFKRVDTVIEIESEALKKRYNEAIADLDEKASRGQVRTFNDIKENLMELRQITGLAKVPYAVEYIGEFLEETNNEKIAIGIHHHAVRDTLMYQLDRANIKRIQIDGTQNAEEKFRRVEKFKDPNERVAILGMLAVGTGTDGLQVCNNALILERQWSSADEEQFEDRFNRPGQFLPVTADYLIIKNSIDEFFANLVNMKRKIFGETLRGNWDMENDSESLHEMVNWVTGHKL